MLARLNDIKNALDNIYKNILNFFKQTVIIQIILRLTCAAQQSIAVRIAFCLHKNSNAIQVFGH